uniref:Neurotransmitter-gated ion-channel transmembrane domain-containing protein n=1 Tax=Globodera rostochiensis TaxID=31243 RepID=A0A914GV24_GLORO
MKYLEIIGSWSYQSEFVRLIVDERDVFLGDFYDNQEWLLVDATIQLLLRRQSFYYVFNLVFPTTLVSLVAVIGFHAPINATGRRESKFRLGVMTLLSLSVMLLMLVDEMKFALESIPGQRGSFSDVPLIGIYYMSLISVISVATCTSSIFVHLEKYAIRNPGFQSVPQWLRFLCAKQLFCCYVPTRVRLDKGDEFRRNKNIRCDHFSSSLDSTNFRTLIPTELNFADFQQRNAQQIAAGNATLEEPPAVMLNSSSTAALLHSVAGGVGSNSTGGLEAQRLDSKLDLLIVLLRELLEARRELRSRGQLPMYWERVIRRLEQCSLCFYLAILALNIFCFMWPELWY